MSDYKKHIEAAMTTCLTETNLGLGTKYRGKVRDTYDLGNELLLVTTDRQSAFDRVLAAVPFKGQVLNLISAWWFEKTANIIPNHLLSAPHPNLMLAKKCTVFPIEFVVRAYITGSTKTSLWTQYQQGIRDYCGHHFPEGLRKNQKLPHALLTPSTKEDRSDRPISADDILSLKLLTEEEWEITSKAALQLFEFGTDIAKQQGLILVDTKYEMGRDSDGHIVLVDELHTPDSSRYWLSDRYQHQFDNGEEPINIDKEFLRLWFIDHCNPYKDKILPKAPNALIITLASRYIELYERITGHAFDFPEKNASILEQIERCAHSIINKDNHSCAE